MNYTLQVGDTVEWSWVSPVGITSNTYTVQQTDNTDSNSPSIDGFQSSAPANADGSYSYQFTQSGSFYYWSGKVNAAGMYSYLLQIIFYQYYLTV